MGNTVNNNQTPITLDDLAAMVNNRFDEVEAEIKKLPTMEQIDLKLSNMEKRLKEDLGEQPMERDRKLDEKTNIVARKLGVKTVFTREEVIEVERMTPFATNPMVE